MTWTSDELDRIGRAEELRISSRRPDGSLRPFIQIWVVRVADDLYVRSAYGLDNPWLVRARAAGEGRIRAGGVERDVGFEDAAPGLADDVTAAFHAKYDRHGPRIVATVVSADAVSSTLRLVAR